LANTLSEKVVERKRRRQVQEVEKIKK